MCCIVHQYAEYIASLSANTLIELIFGAWRKRIKLKQYELLFHAYLKRDLSILKIFILLNGKILPEIYTATYFVVRELRKLHVTIICYN